MNPDAAGVTASLLSTVAAGLEVYDLARKLHVGMPQSPNHPAFWQAMPRRHGDMLRDDGSSSASDVIFMGTHVGTHIDALGHVSQEGRVFGGGHVEQEQRGGRLRRTGIDATPPIVARGVLLDVPALLGVDCCEPAYEISAEELAAAARRQGTALRPGDVILIRTGWGRHWHDGVTFLGEDTGVPGPGVEAAQWLVGTGARAAGADTIMFEHIPADKGRSVRPVHRALLVEAGINILETLDLEPLARDAVFEFLFCAAPLPLVGATGAPVRPLALVGAP